MEQRTTTRGMQASAADSASLLPGQLLTDAAQRDLDAALQLLAHRAQYITGASGAAIALRREGKKDMLCRASIGTNAPELGALLSTELGLSGESVRTKCALRCDDTLIDTRVNREICQQLGIGSVVVMPVVNDDQVLGVFELFSGKANAFGECDLSAVQRLAEMVQIAVQLARAAVAFPTPEKAKAAAAAAGDRAVRGEFVADLVVDDGLGTESTARVDDPPIEAHNAADPTTERVTASSLLPPVPSSNQKKPLLWSAPVNIESDAPTASDLDQTGVPPVLRDLRKCVACGFPVSAGRMLCVECEEKKWKGQLRSRTSQPVSAVSSFSLSGGSAGAAPATAKVSGTPNATPSIPDPSANTLPTLAENKLSISASPASPVLPDRRVGVVSQTISAPTVVGNAPEFVLSAAVGQSQSWFGSHKYVLIALVVIAAAAAAVFFLR